MATALLYGIVRWIAPPADLLAAAAAAEPRWLLLAAALTPIGLVLQWWKWRRLVRAGLPRIGERDILNSLFAGFGLGLERVVQFVTGMANIRDVIPFPRTPGNAEF